MFSHEPESRHGRKKAAMPHISIQAENRTERMLEQLRSRLSGVSDAKLIEGLVADGVPRRLAKAMLAETRGEGTEPGRPLPRPKRSH